MVHGRFHAFDLARELLKQGHEVVLFTNYPKRVVAKFGIPREHVRSFLAHGLLSRAIGRLFGGHAFEALLHQLFGRWAAWSIQREKQFDAIHGFTGITDEYLLLYAQKGTVRSLVRGSAHIAVQARLLAEEARRAGVPIDQPSEWMIQRELREYGMADLIIVLSSFAYQSFLDEGVDPGKLAQVPLGSELKRFRPAAEIIEARCQRILSGQRLRVLTVGTFSYRKGALDLVAITRALGHKCEFEFVGDTPAETRSLCAQAKLKFTPRQPQFELPKFLAAADVFVFPTIEDGYAAVLAQAQAAGLPVLATTNCAAPDIVVPDENGWVLPIRSPEAFIARLEWCDTHRQELAAMVRYTYDHFQGRDWADVAADLVKAYERWFAQH